MQVQGGEHLPDVSVSAVHVGLREPRDAVFIVINTKSLRELLAPSLDTQDGYFLVDPENVLPLNANAVYPTELSYEKRSAEPPTAFHLEGGKAMTALSIPSEESTASWAYASIFGSGTIDGSYWNSLLFTLSALRSAFWGDLSFLLFLPSELPSGPDAGESVRTGESPFGGTAPDR